MKTMLKVVGKFKEDGSREVVGYEEITKHDLLGPLTLMSFISKKMNISIGPTLRTEEELKAFFKTYNKRKSNMPIERNITPLYGIELTYVEL